MPACRHPKNGDQKVDALWIKQQRSRAEVGGVTQLTRDRLRRAMQFAIRDARAFVVPVDWILARARSGVNVMSDLLVAILLDGPRRGAEVAAASALSK